MRDRTVGQVSMNPLRIEQMTVFDVEPAEVVTIAGELGVPLISLWVSAGMEGARPVTAANKRAVLERLRDAPVTVDTVEAFMLSPDPRQAEPGIALAAELGARAIVAINIVTADESAAAVQFAGLCALAARYGLLVGLEPIWMGRTRTPADGLRLVRQSGAANARLTIDLLHVMRTGTPLAELGAIAPELFGSVQICDGPLQIDAQAAREEAAYERMVPGSGAFPLPEFLQLVPPGVPVGLEVPQRALREAGVPARERTRRVVEATRALQRKAADAAARG
jgi:sugar phosphate isomerase/epimerase